MVVTNQASDEALQDQFILMSLLLFVHENVWETSDKKKCMRDLFFPFLKLLLFKFYSLLEREQKWMLIFNTTKTRDDQKLTLIHSSDSTMYPWDAS